MSLSRSPTPCSPTRSVNSLAIQALLRPAAESILCGPSRAGICIQRTYSADIPSIPISTVIHTADVASGRPQTAFDCNVYRIDTGNPIAIGSPSSKIA